MAAIHAPSVLFSALFVAEKDIGFKDRIRS